MAVINALKTVENFRRTNRVNPHYDLLAENIVDLINDSNDKIDIIYNFFTFGYIQGLKAGDKEAAQK